MVRPQVEVSPGSSLRPSLSRRADEYRHIGKLLMSHRFKVGQLVRTRGRNADRSSGIYEIVRLLPPGPDGIPQYRVRGPDRGERVLGEHEIEKA